MSTRTNKRNGLILLVVLGMLALFSIITVSFVVFSSNSNKASTMVAQVKLRQPNSRQLASLALKQILRGTTDTQSAFFGHDLLGDIYGQASLINKRPATIGEFRPASPNIITNPENGVYVINSMEGSPAFIKLPLASHYATDRILSMEDEAYNGRLFTFLGGPLKGKTFRILHYVGERLTSDPDFYLRYSVLLSVTDLDNNTLTSTSVNGEQTRTLLEWLTSPEGTNSLAYSATNYADSSTYTSYKFLINDAPFTGIGYGLEQDDPRNSEFGNLGQAIPLDPSSPAKRLPVGLLHSVDDPRFGNWRLGDTNEGIDVADSRDWFMSYQPATVSSSQDIVPSFHRPEVINHLFHIAFENPGSVDANQLIRLLNLLDYATARPLSITLRVSGQPVYKDDLPLSGQVKSRNIRLKSSSSRAQTSTQLDINLDQWPGTEVAKLQNFVAWLVNGDWDVDNDGDGIKDSMWLDPNLPLVNGPDGKLLKVLVSPMIEDLDGRVNLYTASDLVQSDNTGFGAVTNPTSFVRGGENVSTGFGYGPAEISLRSLFQDAPIGSDVILRSLLVGRNGKDNYSGDPGNDAASQAYERETRPVHLHDALPGLPMSRRGGIGFGLDRRGNPLLLNNTFTNPAGYNFGLLAGTPPSEWLNDPYEIQPRSRSNLDTPHSIGELERLIRRFDSSYANLPTRLQKTLQLDSTYSVSAAINRLLTVRSAEINVPTLSAVALDTADTNGNSLMMVGRSTEPDPTTASNQQELSRLRTRSMVSSGHFFGWVKLLHDQRFRSGTPAQTAQLPELTIDQIRELFPYEFRNNQRFDVNRPFGDGKDNILTSNGQPNGMVDEPLELFRPDLQTEDWPSAATPSVVGKYAKGFAGSPSYMASRQLYARHIYCLAQLIVPRDYRFPGMQSLTGSYADTTAAGTLFRAARARILAQWAVNIVDFRDSDASMTKFPYDETPFGFGPGNNDPAGWNPTSGRVVWGVEFPEMVLSENLAFHDKRTRDTDQDDREGTDKSANPNPDNDQDQYRLPQGSLFIELMNLRATGDAADASLPGLPSSLYEVDPSDGRLKLNLSKTAPGLWPNRAAGAYGPQPVWRIGISNVQSASLDSPNDFLRTPATAGPASSFRTNQFSLEPSVAPYVGAATLHNGLIENPLDLPSMPGSTLQRGFDRMVYFTDITRFRSFPIPDIPAGVQIDRRAFYPSRTQPETFVPGGGYVLVAPRQVTYVGSQDDTSNSHQHMPSPQRIVVGANSVDTFRLNNTADTAWPNARPNLQTLICTTAPPDPTWDTLMAAGTGVYRVGLNISEPISYGPGGPTLYYPRPTLPLNSTDSGGNGFPGFMNMTLDSWKDFGVGGGKTLPDKPYDDPRASTDPPNLYVNPVLNPDPADTTTQDHHEVGTYEDIRSIYLQRLADPDLPYDPVDNPYLTVDWMPVDLTVFNGEDVPDRPPTQGFAFQTRYKDGGEVSLSVTNDLAPVGIQTASAALSVDLGGTRKGPNSSIGSQMLSASTAPLITSQPYPGPGVATSRSPSEANFKYQLGYSLFPSAANINNTNDPAYRATSASSLGYLNVGRPLDNIGTTAILPGRQFDGFEPPIAGPHPYVGSPQLAQNSLFWFNRLFASPYELMYVPAFGPGQIGQNATLSNLQPLYNGLTTEGRFGPFGAFLDFFHSSALKTAPVAPPPDRRTYWQRGIDGTAIIPQNPDLHLLLELLETPQSYIDSHKYFDGRISETPLVASGTVQRSSGNAIADDIRYRMLSLFEAPKNRIPSYINSGKININTIADERVWKAIEWNYLRGTDRNGATGNTNWTAIAESRRGYAPGSTHSFLPNTQLHPNMNPDVPSQFAGAFRSGYAANIAPEPHGPASLRAAVSDHVTMFRRESASSAVPLMTDNRNIAGTDLRPSLGRYPDADRQPVMALQRLSRMANLVSQQSNVFAVHLTIGFFEYDPVEGIGREYEDHAGGLQRSRSMFILDRSVPVGYRVGEDINTENAILSSRFFD